MFITDLANLQLEKEWVDEADFALSAMGHQGTSLLIRPRLSLTG